MKTPTTTKSYSYSTSYAYSSTYRKLDMETVIESARYFGLPVSIMPTEMGLDVLIKSRVENGGIIFMRDMDVNEDIKVEYVKNTSAAVQGVYGEYTLEQKFIEMTPKIKGSDLLDPPRGMKAIRKKNDTKWTTFSHAWENEDCKIEVLTCHGNLKTFHKNDTILWK